MIKRKSDVVPIAEFIIQNTPFKVKLDSIIFSTSIVDEGFKISKEYTHLSSTSESIFYNVDSVKNELIEFLWYNRKFVSIEAEKGTFGIVSKYLDVLNLIGSCISIYGNFNVICTAPLSTEEFLEEARLFFKSTSSRIKFAAAYEDENAVKKFIVSNIGKTSLKVGQNWLINVKGGLN